MLRQFDIDFYMSIIIMCYVGLETPLKIYGNLKGWVKGCVMLLTNNFLCNLQSQES